MKEVVVPDIGDFKDVEVIEILVKAGDTVAKEQSLVSLESDKATMEIPSPEAGVVKSITVKIGDKVSQGSPLLTLEAAVRKMTALPAARLGLADRGVLRVGAKADVVLFDPERVADLATYEDPHQYARGIEGVLVNGRVVVDGGEHTGALPGQVLRKS